MKTLGESVVVLESTNPYSPLRHEDLAFTQIREDLVERFVDRAVMDELCEVLGAQPLGRIRAHSVNDTRIDASDPDNLVVV